jgi:WXG100 family type VII secretion target
MAETYHVDLDRLDDIVAQLRGLAEFLREHLTELDRRVAALHDDWHGTAAQAHADAHREWAAGAAEFADGVARMSRAAEHAHRRYLDAATANTRIFGGRS